jgi:hypothetical protein
MTTRQRLLAAALVATLAATFWPAGEDPVEGVVRSEPRRAQPASRPVAAEAPVQTGVPAASAERLPRMQADLFPRQTWVPPPPPYTPPPPPPPAPPPLPFKYLGRWVDDGRLTVFLVQGDQPIPVASGQVLPGNWRVDEITARSVVFTYLPLDMQSTLGITP